MESWLVDEHEAGLSALEFLQRRLPAAPAGYLRQLLRRGRITGNGRPLAAADVVAPGDRIGLPASGRLQTLLKEAAAAPEILCETREALIVAKPAGLAVHRGAGHEADHLAGRVAALLRRRGERFRCAPVHRLDAATSGPVLFGKGRKAIAAFGQVFMHEPVTKRYLALVAGEVSDAGLLTSPVPVRSKLRTALTAYRSLASSDGCTLLELQLHTGRRHQIRRQLAAVGHPVAGDRRYGGPKLPGLERLFLHCRLLRLPDPFTGSELTACLPLPNDLVEALEALGIAPPPAVC